MAETSAPVAARTDPYAALRFPEFRRLVGGSFLLTLALLAQEVALGYELYLLTRDPLTLGFVGLAEAIPFIALALVGGHLADRREKRNLIVGALLVIAVASGGLIWLSLDAVHASMSQIGWLLAIYSAIVLIGFARGILSPAASSLKAFLIPREHYGNGATWSSAGWQVGAIVGPVAGGLLHAAVGLTGTLMVVMALIAVAALLVSGIRPRGVPPAPEGGDDLWASLKEGMAFVRDTPIILYAITLDLFTVLFGGVVAILPVFAEDVLHVGATEVGLMRASASVGAVLTLLICAWVPPTRHAWRNLLWVVAGFGFATLLFALSKHFWLSMFALFLTGALDSVSVVIRSTILQVYPPDHLRGRVQAVNSVFLSCSNEIGAFESGLAARVMGAVPSVIFGAGMTLAICAGVWARSGKLFAVNLLDPAHDRKSAAPP